MNRNYIFHIILVLLLVSNKISAQELNTQSNQTKLPSGDERRAQNVFVEVLGQGLLFTANYDTRFSNRRNGLGGRAGIGYIAGGGDNATTIPVSLNYLLGQGKHFFEVGLGATFMAAGGDNISFGDSDMSTIVGTMSFAYRVQPIDSGFSFRAGLAPIFNSNFFLPYFPGLSLGYTF